MKIPVSDNQWAVIDADDYHDLFGYTWWLSGNEGVAKMNYVKGYHLADSKRKVVRLHRVIMNVGRGDKRVVHHINGDTLDNRKCNLMIMSHSEHSRKKRTKYHKNK